jgi:PPOX class probable F420-dependent enzyme
MTQLDNLTPEFVAFWTERRLATLTTIRPDGTLHVVPVGVTVDADTATARVISSRGSRKVRNVAVAPGAALVALCQVDGRRWSTLEGQAVIRDDAESVADAERRYAQRYRQPRSNPQRVVIEIALTGVLGNQ